MTNTADTTSRGSGPSAKGLAIAGAQAFGLAAVLNVACFYVGYAMGWIPATVIIPSSGAPLTVGPVIIATLLSVTVATLVRIAFGRIFSPPRASSAFLVLAILLLLASFASPFGIPNVPVAMVVVLNAMHTITAICVLTRFRAA